MTLRPCNRRWVLVQPLTATEEARLEGTRLVALLDFARKSGKDPIRYRWCTIASVHPETRTGDLRAGLLGFCDLNHCDQDHPLEYEGQRYQPILVTDVLAVEAP